MRISLFLPFYLRLEPGDLSETRRQIKKKRKKGRVQKIFFETSHVVKDELK